jgi:hypothetical protein
LNVEIRRDVLALSPRISKTIWRKIHHHIQT